MDKETTMISGAPAAMDHEVKVPNELQLFLRHRRDVEEACANVSGAIKDAGTITAIDFLLEKLNNAWTKFEETYESAKLEFADNKFLPSFVPVREKYMATTQRYVAELTKLTKQKDGLARHEVSLISPMSTTTPQWQKMQVSPNAVPIFAGDCIQWPTFRDLFTAVYITHVNMAPIERLFHLLDRTDGEARQIVQGAPYDNNGFDMAWSGLKNKYENPRHLVETYLQQFANLKPSKMDNYTEVEQLRYTANMCNTILSHYDIDKWKTFMAFWILARLHPTSRSLYEDTLNNATAVPSWEQVDAFLEKRSRSLKATELSASLRPDGFDPSHSTTNHVSNTTVRFISSTKKFQCKLCNANHAIRACPLFSQQSYKERLATVKKFQLCNNCLAVNHTARDCSSKFTCAKCKNKHHTLLHRDVNSFTTKIAQPTNGTASGSQPQTDIMRYDEEPTTSQVVASHVTTTLKKVLLGTAMIDIHINGIKMRVRALIDPASEASFITERIRRRLQLPVKQVNVTVSGVSGAKGTSPKYMSTFQVSSTRCDALQVQVCALVVSQLTGKLPSHAFDTSRHIWPPLTYADPDFFKPGPVDFLVGGDLYPAIMKKNSEYILESLMAQETMFGWIVTGPIPSAPVDQLQTVVSHYTEVTINDQLSKFWHVEEVPQARMLSADDSACEQIFNSTTTRLPNGRYVVHLPFKSPLVPPPLGRSRHIAECQYIRNEKTLLRKPELKAEYDAVLLEYLSLHHMKKVDAPLSGQTHHYYMPHHAVIKPESTYTRVRVVFNASSPTSNAQSLNDALYTGPVLQQDLTVLILQWRLYEFVFNSDIQKMYRQILVTPSHTPYQRIVFRSVNASQIDDFELQTVTFGVSCAPYLAIRTLLRLADDEGDRFPIGAQIIKKCMYVDDVLAGAHTIEAARQARDEIRAILATAGFQLRKWTANETSLLNDLPHDHLLNTHFLSLQSDATTKTLGLRWNAAADEFYFAVHPMQAERTFTKREVLATIAKIFDPAGWLAPLVITAKILMQQLWLDKVEWDEALKALTAAKWQSFITTFNSINDITIPRWMRYTPDAINQIHAFCDASEKAYAAAIYMRVEKDGVVHCNLLVAKSKVAPVKTVSLPRLELCGAVLMANLIDAVLPQLSITNYSLFKWTDSTIVLSWLRKPACTWKTFVANRVASIAEKIGIDSWAHVTSCDNPADVATRGLSPSELKQSELWWKGPKWLALPQGHWPKQSRTAEQTELETKSIKTHLTTSSVDEDILHRFSSLPRTLHVLSYVFRFYRATSHRYHNISSPANASLSISYAELEFVRIRLILLSQQQHFQDDYNRLAQKKPIRSRSNLLTLTPFLDAQQLIRANSRLASAPGLTYNERHPIVIAPASHFAHLYIAFIHQVTLHGGAQLMARLIRHEFWIIQMRKLLKSCMRNCVVCIRQRQQYRQQQMGALPPERTILSRPFAHTGIDFAGPFAIKSFTGRYCRITKGYICLFVCFATKAIHLEVASDLSSAAFLAALARFVARRGCPAHLHSDNGTNFAGAAKILERDAHAFMFKVCDDALTRYGHQRLQWHFNPPSAPHMGGLWEAGVKSFKLHFRKVAGQLKHTMEELSTIMCRIEACLNSRPLTSASTSIDDVSALTPGHFLVGAPLLTPAEPETASVGLHQRWQKIQALALGFCARWKAEYLNELHKREKWRRPQPNFATGDLVVLRNEPTGANEWKLGRVIATHPGDDGQVRVVELQTPYGRITRPIHKLVALPCGTSPSP